MSYLGGRRPACRVGPIQGSSRSCSWMPMSRVNAGVLTALHVLSALSGGVEEGLGCLWGACHAPRTTAFLCSALQAAKCDVCPQPAMGLHFLRAPLLHSGPSPAGPGTSGANTHLLVESRTSLQRLFGSWRVTGSRQILPVLLSQCHDRPLSSRPWPFRRCLAPLRNSIAFPLGIHLLRFQSRGPGGMENGLNTSPHIKW